MLSRKNIAEKQLRLAVKKQKFSVRKLSTGVFSIAIGSVFLLSATQVAKADSNDVVNTNAVSLDAVDQNRQNLQNDNKVILKAGGSNQNQPASQATNSAQQVQEPVVNNANTTVNQSVDNTATPVQVGNVTKNYDGHAGYKAYQIQLADGLLAPDDWVATNTKNVYEIMGDSTDVEVKDSSANVGTYSLSLSDTGLAKLNAVNPGRNITSNDVSTGNLVINQTPLQVSTILIRPQSKAYDNDESTDPTSYTVLLKYDNLVLPSDWVKNADGTYTVPFGVNGDGVYLINPASFSQNIGRYDIGLTSQALAELKRLNPNYTIPDLIAPYTFFSITNASYFSIGLATIKTGSALPTTISVLPPTGSVVPSDWQAGYSNAGYTVYNVPISYFDTSKVDPTKVGNYEITFTPAAIQTLENLNSSTPHFFVRTESGTVVVSDANPTVSLTPSNFGVIYDGPTSSDGPSYTTSSGQVTHYHQATISQGSVVTLNTRFLGFNISNSPDSKVNNLSEIFIVPDGFAILDGENGSEAFIDPASVLKQQIMDHLNQLGLAYNADDVKVTRLDNYHNREAFLVQFNSEVLGDSHKYQDGFFPIELVQLEASSTTSGFIGPYTGAVDDANLYVTSDTRYTGGSYSLNSDAYTNVPSVATYYGLSNAFTLAGDIYQPMWVTHYEIKQTGVTTKVNIKLQDLNGNVISKDTSFTGNNGDFVNLATSTTADGQMAVPATISLAGNTYALQSVTDQDGNVLTSPLILLQVKNGVVAEGSVPENAQEYTTNYVEIVGNVGHLNKDNEVYGSVDNNATLRPQKATNKIVFDNIDGWNAANQEATIDLGSGDLIVYDQQGNQITGISQPLSAGTYTVKLSPAGLAKLAAANPKYALLANAVSGSTFTVADKTIPVTVADNEGNQLTGGNITLTGHDGTSKSLDIKQAGYANNEIGSIVVTNDNGTTVTYKHDPATNTWTNSSDDDTSIGYLPETLEKLLSLGTTNNLTSDEQAANTGINSIEVVYNAKKDLPVSYYDQTNGKSLPALDQTITVYKDGLTHTYDAIVPAGYQLAPGQASQPTYDFASSELVINLVVKPADTQPSHNDDNTNTNQTPFNDQRLDNNQNQFSQPGDSLTTLSHGDSDVTWQTKLPQTGEQKSHTSVLGLLSLSGLAMLGLISTRKSKY